MAAPASFDLQPTLTGALIALRPLRADEFEALYAVASDPLVWELHPESDRWKREVFELFFAGALASKGALAAVDPATGRVIGGSRFYGHDPAARTVVIGYTFLARAYWGGRHNREMKKLMLDHAFRFVDAVLLHVGEDNLRSRRAVEKIGGVATRRFAAQDRHGAARMNVEYRIAKDGPRP